MFANQSTFAKTKPNQAYTDHIKDKGNKYIHFAVKLKILQADRNSKFLQQLFILKKNSNLASYLSCFIRSDEGLTLETSAFESLYGG